MSNLILLIATVVVYSALIYGALGGLYLVCRGAIKWLRGKR